MTFNPCMGRAVLETRKLMGGFSKEQPNFSVCELGSQTLSFALDGKPDIKNVPDFYGMLGFTRYESIDLDNKATLQTDLNKPQIPEEWAGAFDLVTNNGTGEHIFNQAAIFEVMHVLCKAGGMMIHVVPWINWLNHGFYNLHPRIFGDVADANGYKIEFMWSNDRDDQSRDNEISLEETKVPPPQAKNIVLAVCMRKQSDGEFAIPIQGKYRYLARGTAVSQSAGRVADAVVDGLRGVEQAVAHRSHDPEVAGASPAPATPSIIKRRPKSVLEGVTPHMIEVMPFPHIIGRLPDDYYRELEATWPKPEEIIPKDKDQGDNKLFQANAATALGRTDLPQIWRDFFAYHSSGDFLAELWRIFGNGIEQLYPPVGQLPKQTAIRGTQPAPWQLDCQFAVNTPARTYGSVRGPHVDNPVEVYAGLVYFPHEGDKTGGEIVLYKPLGAMKFVGKAELSTPRQESKVLPYEPGNFVFFVNSMLSIHGVRPRVPSSFYRRYVNIIGEVGFGLFNLPR